MRIPAFERCALRSRVLEAGVFAARMRNTTVLCLAVAMPLAISLAVHWFDANAQTRRAVTVVDSIEMTKLVPFTQSGHAAQFSPDGRHFVVLTDRGDVSHNERLFSIELFETASVLHLLGPDNLISMSTRSNADAVSEVRWFDNNTITFLGAPGDEGAQVYAVGLNPRKVKKLTNHPSAILAYAISSNMERVLYTAIEQPTPDLKRMEAVRQRGLVVAGQQLADLVAGDFFNDRPGYETGVIAGRGVESTFVYDLASGRVRPIARAPSEVIGFLPQVYRFSPNPMSPDGRFAILRRLTKLPPAWRVYTPLANVIWASRAVPTLDLVDLDTGATTPLLNAPAAIGVSAAWLPGGRSVVVANTYLPLEDVEPSERARRQIRTAVVEVEIPSKRLSRVEAGPLDGLASNPSSGGGAYVTVLGWDTARVALAIGYSTLTDRNVGIDPSRVAFYRRTSSGWNVYGPEVDWAEMISKAPRGTVSIWLAQDLNTPPNLVARDERSARTVTFTDLNPQFRDLEFGRVSLIHWVSKDGNPWDGNLYLPPRFMAGVRYPVVLQTHHCALNEFWIDGYGTTANAAQALAGKGIVVLQIGRCDQPREGTPFAKTYGTPAWVTAEVNSYYAAIDELDRRGLVDRNRVGIIGFSMTGPDVDYALTHPVPGYHFAAATTADGADLNYLTYLAYPGMQGVIRGSVGASPFGEEFEAFRRNTSAMNVDRVTTPLRIEVQGGERAVAAHWELYAALKALGKPVEMIVFPDAKHVLVKPSQRMTSQQGNVDWFCFWLKGEEDPDPAKAEQYVRWRELQKMQEQNETKSRETSPAAIH